MRKFLRITCGLVCLLPMTGCLTTGKSWWNWWKPDCSSCAVNPTQNGPIAGTYRSSVPNQSNVVAPPTTPGNMPGNMNYSGAPVGMNAPGGSIPGGMNTGIPAPNMSNSVAIPAGGTRVSNAPNVEIPGFPVSRNMNSVPGGQVDVPRLPPNVVESVIPVSQKIESYDGNQGGTRIKVDPLIDAASGKLPSALFPPDQGIPPPNIPPVNAPGEVKLPNEKAIEPLNIHVPSIPSVNIPQAPEIKIEIPQGKNPIFMKEDLPNGGGIPK